MTTGQAAAARCRIIYMGTPAFAVPALQHLAEAHEIIAVYSQPPSRRGRGMVLQPAPVHQAAEDLGLAVHTPQRFDAEQVSILQALAPAFLVVVAYGLILPPAVLAIPTHGAINGHASLLPRWRGAAPLQRAIEAGDSETGMTAMLMESGLDSGPLLATCSTAISNDDTAGSLHDRLAAMTGPLLAETIAGFAAGRLAPQPQPQQGITWATKISSAEAELDFSAETALLCRRIRAFSPFPAAWLMLTVKAAAATATKSVRLRVHSAAPHPADSKLVAGTVLGPGRKGGLVIATADQALEITRLQPAGKPPMAAADFFNGYSVPKQVIRHSSSAD